MFTRGLKVLPPIFTDMLFALTTQVFQFSLHEKNYSKCSKLQTWDLVYVFI